MFFAYVIQSIPDPEYLYKGHCNDIDKRLKQHNAGMTKSIRHKLPFRLVYFEQFETIEEAIKRERYWKTAAGRRYLHNILNP